MDDATRMKIKLAAQVVITELLLSTERAGMKTLVESLETKGFFESPASTRYHGCYPGGLAEHSFDVYRLLSNANKSFKFGIPEESIIIAALLHDVCKVGAYQPCKIVSKQKYANNPDKEKGHALLSLARIKQHIELTGVEELMIKYHMGVYGLKEFDEKSGEYELRNRGMANAWYNEPIVKVMYFCDEFATFQNKARESILA